MTTARRPVRGGHGPQRTDAANRGDPPPRSFESSVRPCEYAYVPVQTHAHPVDAASVAQAQGVTLSPSEGERLARLLGLLADPIRVRMLFCLVAVDELCVGDLAMALGISMDQSSYALKLLRTAGLVESRRDGRVMYYRLAVGFPHQLLDHCLRQLLTIAAKEGRS
jgi:DNA-binding transcriptional ArsR family regulator